MADSSLGNVVLSRPFQFVELQTVTSAVFDREIVWMPSLPKTFAPIKTRWIYAFEVGERNIDQKPILAAEYHADQNGALGFVPGLKRRAVDATEKSAPLPAPVPAAALPLVRQGKRLRYVFVATRGRMGKRAIWEMENGLHPIYERTDLADDYSFKHAADAPNGPFFVLTIDPLTLGENLHLAYEQALNEAINYTVAHEHNPKKADVEVRSRKYQLAKMIKDTLLAPEGEVTDPFKIRDYLAGGGQPLIDFINEHESKARKLDWGRRNAARELVRLLNSAVWGASFKWYLGTQESTNRIGHLWLDVSFRCIDRLGETPEGTKLIRELIADRANGLLSYLYPTEELESDAEERYKVRFAVARKAATGVVIGLAETAPALIVHAKTSAANRQIQRTLREVLTKDEVSIIVRGPDGHVTRALRVTTKSVHIEINYTHAKANLEKWIEEGKPHWPDGTIQAKASELLARIFIAVELVNLYNEVTELKKEDSQPVKVIGAVLDLVVAAEDPVRALATRLRPARGAGELGAEASSGLRGVVAAAEEKETAGLLGKLVAPAAFKLLGAVSAAIDVYFNFQEARQAGHRGETGLMVGKGVVAGGSLLLATGSVLNASGYLAQSALLTAASATLLVVGVVIVVLGLALVAYVSMSSWQKFVRHSSFGDKPGYPGHEAWSAGDFSEWSATVSGLNRQIEVFTAMLCAYKIAGVGFDAQTITVTLGTVPPNAKLEIEFVIDYENGQTRRPAYVVDLETAHVKPHGDITPVARFAPYREAGRIHSILLAADRPESLQRIPVRRSSCSVVLRYARGSQGSAASGTIPIAGHLDYEIFDGSGMGRFSELSSLEPTPE